MRNNLTTRTTCSLKICNKCSFYLVTIFVGWLGSETRGEVWGSASLYRLVIVVCGGV